MAETIIDWQSMETAPRDGSIFMAWCVETGRQGVDQARWDGKSPRDPIGRFATRYGWIVAAWAPMPKPPEKMPYIHFDPPRTIPE